MKILHNVLVEAHLNYGPLLSQSHALFSLLLVSLWDCISPLFWKKQMLEIKMRQTHCF